MSGTFNPYQTWLEIPPAEQPPHHYRLLGVPPYEANTTVISLAADRQISFLESVEDGQHAFLAQQLIKSIEAARACLLDPQRKANYDAKLKGKQAVSGAAGKAATNGASARTAGPRAASGESSDTDSIRLGAAEAASAGSPWAEVPDWMSEESPPASKASPAQVSARAAAAPPRALPRAKPSAESSDGGDDSLSFLGGPGGKRPSAVASSSAPRSRATPAMSSQARANDPRSAGKEDAEKKPNTARMMAIFVPTIITLLILVVVVGIWAFGGGDKKKSNDAAKMKGGAAPKTTQSFDDMWSKSGLPKNVPAMKPK